MSISDFIEYPEEYHAYFRLFNERDFYEAHEVLEDLWVIEVGEVRNFYKALIMMAAAAFQWQRGVHRGARRLYQCADAYLSEFTGTYEGLNVPEYQECMRETFERLLQQDNAAPPQDGEWPMVELILEKMRD